MPETLRRTHATSLTDDELTLFDVLFDCCAGLRLLRRDAIWGTFLRRHSLDDEQLDEALRQFVAAGWMTSRPFPKRFGPNFELTPEGGALWESERLPDWNRYATESYDESSVKITATSPQTCEDFFRVGRETGFFEILGQPQILRASYRDPGRISWKDLGRLHVLIAVYDEMPCDEQTSSENWRFVEQRLRQSEEMEGRRTWWRSADEADKFWPTPI